MLVIKYPDAVPFRHVDGRLKDLELLSGTIRWIIEGDKLIEAHISSISYSLVDEIYTVSSESWSGKSSSFLWSCFQQIINKCNRVHARASYVVTNGQFELTAACLRDQPNNYPSSHSLDYGSHNIVYGKLPQKWGYEFPFPTLTVGVAATVIKEKVDEYLSTQENLEKMLSKAP